MNSKVYFVFIIYNLEVKKLTLIESLSSNIILIDNGDLGDSYKKNGIKVINKGLNLGFGRGANVGIKLALERGAEWIAVMNQDLVITKNTLDKFITKIINKKAGIVGPFGGELDENRWTTILPSMKIDYISGACMAIHRDVIDKVGYFYDPYFMYYEDADYCMRAQRAGFPLIPIEVPGISHADCPTLGRGSYLHQYYLARNHLLFVERQAPLAIKLYEYLRLPMSVFETTRNEKKGTRDGINDYFLRRFGEKKL